MPAAQRVEPCRIRRAQQRRNDDRRRTERRGLAQISTRLPSSTTREVGRRKNSIALTALRSIQANRRSLHSIIPGLSEGSNVWRARKKLVSIKRNQTLIHMTEPTRQGKS